MNDSYMEEINKSLPITISILNSISQEVDEYYKYCQYTEYLLIERKTSDKIKIPLSENIGEFLCCVANVIYLIVNKEVSESCFFRFILDIIQIINTPPKTLLIANKEYFRNSKLKLPIHISSCYNSIKLILGEFFILSTTYFKYKFSANDIHCITKHIIKIRKLLSKGRQGDNN